MAATVTAVVVNYNGQDCLKACLESLRDQNRPFDEVIVVDNASEDESAAIVSSEFENFRLMALNQNAGYPGACNLALDETSSELIAIFNNDVVLDPRWLEVMLARNSDPWSLWASKILFSGNRDRIDSAGDSMAVVGTAFKNGHGAPAGRFNEEGEVFGPCGAAALYRRSVLADVLGFDQDFFLIYEDADLAMRARLRGHRCLYVPEALVYHNTNSSIRTLSSRYVFFGHRNSEFVFWQNMPLSLLLRYLPERLLFDLFCAVYFTARGKGWSFFRAKLNFLRNFGTVLRKRRRIQMMRAVESKAFRKMLVRNWLRGRRIKLKNP